MIFRNNFSFKTLIAALLVFVPLGAFAAANTVSAVNVNQTPAGGYKILIKTDKNAVIKKQTDSDSLIITVGSAIPAGSSEIIYDNAPGIRNITLQKKNDDTTIITLQGDNIQNSQIYLKDALSGKTTEAGNDNALFYVADKKLLAYSAASVFSMFFFAVFFGSKRKREEETALASVKETLKNTENTTLRHKAMTQRRNIPSINARINERFSSYKVSRPYGFAYDEEISVEKERKAG